MTKTQAAAAERKIWKSKRKSYALRETPAGTGDTAEELTKTLLVSRGFGDKDEADAFLNPDYDAHVHDPFLLKGMEEAVVRILAAIEENERIAIYSDYDADGIPGGVVLHDFFRKIGYANFENYIPHRHDEGFGLNTDAVEKLAKSGVKLMITVDCGITDIAEVAHAKSLGIDTIITDHHLPSAEGLPDAVAIVDHKQEGCAYPDKNLCGSGVAFKLVQALLSRGGFDVKDGWEKWLLDMVGLATLSDMVPLTGENRVFAFYGMKVIRKSPRVGLVKLLQMQKLDQKNLTEDDVAFMVTPRINAASRMGVPMEAFTLLSTEDHAEADRLARYLDKINDERKGIVAGIVREAKRHIEERDPEWMKPVVVMGNPDWRPSLLGLVANTLSEEMKRPVFLWGREGGELLKGSCRSGNGANVVELMERAKGVLSDFGGHRMSGGFSVSHETVHLLEEKLVGAYRALAIETSGETEIVELDRMLDLDDVSWKTFDAIDRLAPYGCGNPKPLFVFPSSEIESVRTFGKGDLHAELCFKGSRGKVTAIAFFTKPESYGVDLAPGRKVDVIATLEKSTFRGRTELRLRLVDIA